MKLQPELSGCASNVMVWQDVLVFVCDQGKSNRAQQCLRGPPLALHHLLRLSCCHLTSRLELRRATAVSLSGMERNILLVYVGWELCNLFLGGVLGASLVRWAGRPVTQAG